MFAFLHMVDIFPNAILAMLAQGWAMFYGQEKGKIFWAQPEE